MKRTPLTRRTPLNRGDSTLRRTPLKQVSKKRRSQQAARRQFVHDTLQARPVCQAGPLVTTVDRTHQCQRTATDVHEVLTRARGGDILSPDNVRALCRACHDWVHNHPHDATHLGLLESQYMTRDD